MDKFEQLNEIWLHSSIDKTKQPFLFLQAKEDARPLLVGLHTWSHDRFNQISRLVPLAVKNDWNLLLPEFRGPNTKDNPNAKDACGSLVAKQDIIDAVEYVRNQYKIDSDNILLIGASGGGHMALLMAAYAPKLWKAVCSFVPITDIRKWRIENQDYSECIRACCGEEPMAEKEYKYRSPIYYCEEIAKARVKIFSGKWDNIVPCHHGLDLYNKIFEHHPEAEVYIEVFDGGHEMRVAEAERWFAEQINKAHLVNERVTG